MTFIEVNCSYCGNPLKKGLGHYNRSIKLGMGFFCDRKCCGLSKKTSTEEKREQKRIYDKKYRSKNLERIKKNKKEYFKNNKIRQIWLRS